jgi:nitrite reductase (NADH) large subunit
MQHAAADSRLWQLAKGFSVLAALAVVGLLVARPSLGLFVTWKLLVPAVPLLLLIAPEVWRNLCPISVVHQLPAALGRGGRARPTRRMQRIAPLIAGILFFLIVPLRLVLFNENGAALAVFVVVVLIVALAGGLFYYGKSGWCVTLCPVLPVERLYGQRPVVPVDHAHCSTCTGCVRSCYDLKPERSLDELLDPAALLQRRTRDEPTMPLLHTPMGWFAGAFPGFVLGYFLHPGDISVAATYLWLGGFALMSILLFAAVQRMTAWSGRTLAKWAAALAVGCYYWFTVRDVAQSAHELLAIPAAPALGINAIRALLLTISALWLFAALRNQPRPTLATNRAVMPRAER